MPCECFYTFPYQIDERRILWRSDRQLLTYIESLCQEMEESKKETLEGEIARHLLRQLQESRNNSLLKKSWSAFLLRRTEKVIKRDMLAKFPTGFDDNLFCALFSIGVEVVDEPLKFLASFDDSRCRLNYWYPTFKKFIDRKIKYCLLPKIRELTGLSTLGQTDLGLAARSSRRQVREALSYCYEGEAKLARYLLAWQAFQEVRQAIGLPINNYQQEHFKIVADRYNTITANSASDEEIKLCLEKIGRAIRQLLEPKAISLDDYSFNSNDEAFESKDKLIDRLTIVEKSQEDLDMEVKANSLKEYFNHLLDALSIDKKQLLWLRYGLNLKQTSIALELGIDQPTASYRLRCCRNKVFQQILTWLDPNVPLEINVDLINEIEALLSQYHADKIARLFQRAIAAIATESQPLFRLLHLFYVASQPTAEIARTVEQSQSQVKELLETIEQWLSDWTVEKIEAEINLEFQQRELIKNRLPAIARDRLPSILQRD